LPSTQGVTPAETIRIGVLKNGSYEIVTLPLETYVARVLTGEALPGSKPAALETLAIAIRTYALGNRGRHGAEGFDLCDQTHCQVMRSSTPVTERAALATAGEVLLYKGQPATVYYSASCGGRTEKPSNVWPGAEDPPYLPSRVDDGCGGAPEWSAELSADDLQRALRAAGFNGALRTIRIAARNESGRAARLTLDGMTPAEISGQDLRAAVGRTIGWQYIQSAAFELTRSGRAFRFEGHGNGHGVGLCVIGSTKLAIAGESAAQILQRYFPGTDIGTVGPRLTAAPAERPTPSGPPPAGARVSGSPAAPLDVVVSLPEGDEGERFVMASLVGRERDDLARTLGVPAPSGVSVRFHPTTYAFEQATGRPWFTLGAVAGPEVQFIPLAVLRDRGILERTVRHEVVHMLADRALAGRPAWVREGAAAHYAERQNGPTPRVACPQDTELTRPVSIGAFTDASRRARACFERQLAAKKDWREVR
jgi:stage II sporulation protein D (peptidoglycan lytic transglycosylase)